MQISRMFTWQEGKLNHDFAESLAETACRWSQNFDSETDWNIVTEPMDKVDNRQVKVSRGRFLGGSSGVNGTLCIRGIKQDYDDWGLDEWTGDKMFEYMKKARYQY